MRTLSQEERCKYEVARELGLLPKLEQVGWAGLSTAESGRVGGLVGARLRQRRKEQQACTLPLPASTTP
ncbi:MAG: small, acid-soluble spore protein, alpha/beta type [Clostridia bacterium]|nr:small, acid-soluble spore protein, alpha/beta type [Clostridia bacterium]